MVVFSLFILLLLRVLLLCEMFPKHQSCNNDGCSVDGRVRGIVVQYYTWSQPIAPISCWNTLLSSCCNLYLRLDYYTYCYYYIIVFSYYIFQITNKQLAILWSSYNYTLRPRVRIIGRLCLCNNIISHKKNKNLVVVVWWWLWLILM